MNLGNVNGQDRLRVGILGCGAIAQFAHLPAMARAKRVSLTALCDGAGDLLETIGQRTGVACRYTDYVEFLREAPIDAVVIAVPDDFHVPRAMDALRAGKHVLVEKPLGSNAAECRELAALVRESGLCLQIGSMKRHDPGVVFARQFVREKAGAILTVSAVYRDSMFRQAMQESCLAPLLRSVRSIQPKVEPKANLEHYNLVTQGAHLFDLIHYLGGAVIAVTARVAKVEGQYSWHGLLEFFHGGTGHFELTCKACWDWQEQYAVGGTTGMVEIDVSLPFYHRPARVRAFDGATQQWTHPLGEHSNAYANQLDAFAGSVLQRRPVNPDVYEAIAVMDILDAVERSVRSGGRIEVAEPPRR
jgi:predicted dehydrogenase